MTTSEDDLLADLLADLEREGVQFGPWEAMEDPSRPRLVGVAYAPSEGLPTQAFLKPVETRLAIVVARDLQRRLRAFAEGDLDVFQSWDAVNERAVALIYDKSDDTPRN